MRLKSICTKLKRLPPGLRHCGILTLVLAAVLLAIGLAHPGAVYGAQTDWSNQHFAIPEYFRTRFYATGNWFPDFALHLGGGQNIYNLAYYGLYSPIILFSYAFPWVSMATYLQVASVLLTLISAYLCYFWLRKWLVPRIACFGALLFLCGAPIIFHSHHHLMFVSYFPFLFWGFFGVHRALERRWSLGLLAAAVLIILTSFYFSVGAFLALICYGVFLVLYQHHVHVRRQLLRGLLILAVHLGLAVLIAGFFLVPVACTLLNGRDETNAGLSLWKILLPGIYVRYFTYSPFSLGLTSFGILVPLAMLRGGLRPCRFLSVVFLGLLCLPAALYLMNGTMYLDPKAYIPLLPLMVLLCGFFVKRLAERPLTWLPTVPLLALVLALGYWFHDGTKEEQIALLLDGGVLLGGLMLSLLRHNWRLLLIPVTAMSLVVCFAVNIGDTYMQRKDLEVVYSEEIQALVDNVTASDNGFYRISNEYHAGDTVNRIWGSRCYRSSIYSSVHTATFSDFYFHQVYNENSIRNAAMIVQSKNPIYAMLMGEKYVLSKKPLHRYGLRLIEQRGAYRLYENTLALPIGFATSHIMSLESLKSLGYPAKLPALLENAIVAGQDIPEDFQRTAKTPEGLRRLSLPQGFSGATASQITCLSEGYYIHSQKAFTITVPLNTPITDLLLVEFSVNNRLGNGSTTGDVTITVNGVRNKLTDPAWKYQNENRVFRYTISSDQPIETLEVTFSAGDYMLSHPAIYTIPNTILENAGDQVAALSVDPADLGDDTISGTIAVDEASWFVLAIPYDPGFTLLVDGVETAIVKTDVDLIGCPLSPGTHTIYLSYRAPGADCGAVLSAIGICAAIAWIVGNIWLGRKASKTLR